ncbi:MAG: NAD-dependent epimerase/dehydratase family protein [Candidatus Komeilibacteria bacterium]|jgi:dTDP-glucose 4,6-dehydratase|nr:NAD-dependent epimerase/dehydratase family protein [Candidatus Komeilibacteria bacterium]MBT4448022.1 NAD-dependent epimerase/dehydratase family protein [Candidatus Komeilibacteria bacterium]
MTSKNKPKYEPKSILITGGAGFIASNVLRYFWKQYPNTHFHVLDALTYAGDMKNIDDAIHSSDRFTFWYGDIRNERLVDKIISQSEIVLHLAAETHVTRSIYDDINFFETDVIGTQVIANAVLRHKKTVKRFIHISTSEVYGTAMTEDMDESHPLQPQSPYAAAKTGADRLVYSYYHTHKIPAVIVRPFNAFGPNQHLEKLIPRFITSVLLKEPMTIHGDGSSSRDFVHVIDIARALDMIIQASAKDVEGEVFNVGTNKVTSVLEIAQLIEKLMLDNGKQKMEFSEYTLNVDDRPGQVNKHLCNYNKIKKCLGWEPTITLEGGMKDIIDWYVNNRDWWESKVWMRQVPIVTETGKVEFH